MYAKGMTTRQISDILMDIYGFEASEGFISDVTDKLLPQIEEWQKRPPSDIYPVIFIDAIHYSVRDNNVIRKLAAYIILGINCEGRKEVLSIQVGENESAKYWLSVLNELRNRGVKDILILCADGLTGIKDAIAAAYPQTEYQRCIVHQVRNTLKYVSDKERKAFANDPKTIYNAPSEQEAREVLDEVTEKWREKYPRAMKRWYDNWDAVSPIFKFSKDVRTVIYTTNAIESLNSTYRRLNSQRSVFPSDTALLKALYLSTFEATKKWTMPIHNWGGMIRCPNCGCNYRRTLKNGTPGWICPTYYTEGKAYCQSKKIPEDTMKTAIMASLGMETWLPEVFQNQVDHMIASGPNTIELHLTDGKVETIEWKDRSRRESWTLEMKEKARQNAFRRNHG